MSKCAGTLVLTVPILALCLISIPGMAHAAPPVPESCAQQDHGARVKCKYGNVLMQQQATADMIITMDEFPQIRKNELMEQTARGMREQSRVDAADFRMLTKKRNPKCQVVEITGDGRGNDDGECKGGNEDCAEVIGDGIGDDDGICHPRNGKKREVCVEICDDEGVALDSDNFDETGRGMETEMQLDLLTVQYMEANEMLEEEMMKRSHSPSPALTSDDACLFESREGLGGVVDAFKIAKDNVEVVKNMADKFCEFDASGFNVAFVCILPSALFSAVEITTNMMEFDSDIKQNEVVDYSFACLHDVGGAIQGNNEALDDIEMDIEHLEGEMIVLRTRIAELKTLVLTPLGQR